jgi:prepilin-type processing-associated H-X9-DG protein
LKPYVANNAVYICPSDKAPYLQTDGVKTSYSFNANLEGVSVASVKNSSQVVLFYEGKNGKLNFRHNGKASVAFVDGKTTLVSEKEAHSLRWKP